jgi:conjugal transfer/entry exclusion protein
MADNDQLLDKIGNLIDQKLEPIKKDLQEVKQTQAAQGSSIAQNTTLLEAVAAGQQEMQATVATRADVLDVKAGVVRKLQDHESRIEELEKDADIPHPHKH